MQFQIFTKSRTKISDEKAKEIRYDFFNTPLSAAEIALKHKIAKSTVARLCGGSAKIRKGYAIS